MPPNVPTICRAIDLGKAEDALKALHQSLIPTEEISKKRKPGLGPKVRPKCDR